MKNELIVYTDPRSPISEIFRTLRTNIQFMNKKKGSQTILVTSTNVGEGKSWITANLAVTMAQTGKKVIIIDGDMRRGRTYSIFKASPKPGLSNYLSGVDVEETEMFFTDVDDYIQHTKIENLDLMPAGNIPPNPSELLILPQMVELLDELKQNYDLVIIDGTPCKLVTDSLIIARMVDSVIVVAACQETKKKELERVIESIKNVGGKLFGVVLNKVPVSTKKYISSYYYGDKNK